MTEEDYEVSKKGFRARLGEFWKGRIVETKQPLARLIRSQYIREAPEGQTFEKMIKFHDRTPQIQIAVSTYAELITGTEMLLNTKSEKATDFLNEWVRRTQFYDKFESIVNTILITGNALVEKLDETQTDDILEVDMSTIIGKKRDKFGKLEWYDHRQLGGGLSKLGEGKLGRFIEFNLTNYSRQAWGKALAYSLMVPRTVGNRTTAPLVEIMWSTEDAMGAMLVNNAYPITTITYPGASDKYLKKEAERWQKYKPGDKRVQKIKPEIEFYEPSPQSKYTDYINHLEKAFELGTQFPHDIMTGEFTSRASSETTENIVMKRVRGYQRYLANKLKTELFDPILSQNGFDPEKEELEITFTTQDIIKMKPEQVQKLYTDKVISLKEMREWVKSNVGIELTDDKQMLADDELRKQQSSDQINSLEQEVKKLVSERDMSAKFDSLYGQLERKLELVKQAKQDEKDKRIKALEKIVKKVTNLNG